jgi:transposase-like protein
MDKVNVRRLKGNRRRIRYITRAEADHDQWRWMDGTPIDSEQMVLSLLLPPTVKEFFRRAEAEVEALCGPKGKHTEHPYSRWTTQKGSVYLGGQQVGIMRRRLRDTAANREIELPIYRRHQDPAFFDRAVCVEGLKRVSQRDYAKGLPQVAGSFGFSKGTVSKAWIRASQAKFDEMMNRDLKLLCIVAVFIDGKRFRSHGVVVALGTSSTGKKYVLGIYEADTENETGCLGLLNDIEKRGVPSVGILYIVDGGGGLNKALESKYAVHDPKKREAIRLRCHNHKWDNLEKHLKKADRPTVEACSLFNAMKKADSLSVATAHADALEALLKRQNISALKSFQQAREALLMLHHLELSPDLRRFFSTTNPMESVNSITEEDMRRVKRWKDSSHFQRWCATMSLNAEKRMRRVRGWRGLASLRQRLLSLCSQVAVDRMRAAA